MKVYLCGMKKVVLKRKISNRVINGHPWIFSNEIDMAEESLAAGDIASVFTHDDKFIGKGYVNPESRIPIRLLTRNKAEEIDAAFFLRKIKEAWEYRQRIGYVENCRLIFGEADGLP